MELGSIKDSLSVALRWLWQTLNWCAFPDPSLNELLEHNQLCVSPSGGNVPEVMLGINLSCMFRAENWIPLMCRAQISLCVPFSAWEQFPLPPAEGNNSLKLISAAPLESTTETVYRDSKQLGLHECNWGQNLPWHTRVPFQKGHIIPHENAQIPRKNVWLSLQPCDLFCWPVEERWG